LLRHWFQTFDRRPRRRFRRSVGAVSDRSSVSRRSSFSSLGASTKNQAGIFSRLALARLHALPCFAIKFLTNGSDMRKMRPVPLQSKTLAAGSRCRRRLRSHAVAYNSWSWRADRRRSRIGAHLDRSASSWSFAKGSHGRFLSGVCPNLGLARLTV
jgi:hypothetical protein